VDNSASLQPARSRFISRGKSVQTSGATSLLHQTFRVHPCTSTLASSCITTADLKVTGNLATSIESIAGLGMAQRVAVESMAYARRDVTREILVLGIPEANGTAGMVKVFTRDGSNAWVASPSLTKGTGAVGDRFGHSLALSQDGRWLAVGAPGDDTVPDIPGVQAHDAGAVYFYELQPDNVLTFRSVIYPPNPGRDDAFGSALAMDAIGQFMAVGAPFEDSKAQGSFNATDAVDQYADASASTEGYDFGAVYGFVRIGTAWALQRYVKPVNTLAGASPDARSRSYFGSSIAFSGVGSPMAVGAPGSSRGAANGGSVQVFQRDASWAFQYEVYPSTDESTCVNQAASPAPTQRRFGAAVSLNRVGDRLAIGDPGASAEGVPEAGVVHLMSRAGTTWMCHTTLNAENPARYARFGSVVALNGPDGQHLSVGVPGDRSALAGLQRPAETSADTSDSRAGSGSVYRYQYVASEWKLKARLKAPTPTIDARLGLSLTVDREGDFIAVGSEARDDLGGAIFIY
jgi:hypothetical protein